MAVDPGGVDPDPKHLAVKGIRKKRRLIEVITFYIAVISTIL